ncbi:hypothetical protein C0993_010465 [Termitomyces sp. T159_Od127]|nr:hypothetical protein C0993_010465 [Termitomyces sp. T159_Od127]
MGYRYTPGLDYTPVIPLESRQLVPSIQRQYPEPVIPALPSQTPNSAPHIPVIPPTPGHVVEPAPHVQTPRHLSNAPVQDAATRTSTVPLKHRSTRRRRRQNSLVFEVTMGDGEHTSSTYKPTRSQVSKRSSQTTASVDMREQSSRDQRHYRSAEHQHASSVANTSKQPVINDDYQPLSAEDQPQNFFEDSEEVAFQSGAEPLVSGPRRRINRVQTPYHRPRSLQLSDQGSPASSHSTKLSAQPFETPGQLSNSHSLPRMNQDQGSVRSYARSLSSYTTAADTYAPPTFPTTPTSNADATLSRLSYQDNPLPPPPVDIFELPEWQHLRYLLEIPPKRDNIGQVNVAIGDASPVRSLSTGSTTQKQKKGLFRVFSLKKSAPSAPSPTRNGSVRSQGSPHHSTAEAAVALLSRLAPYVVVNTTPQQRSMEPTGQATPQAPVLSSPPLSIPTPQSQAAYQIPVPNMVSYFPGTPSAGPPPSNYAPVTVHSNHSPSIPPVQDQTRSQPEVRPPFPQFQTHHPKRILFDVNSEYSSFLMHSPHPVVYKEKTYPTAAHLLEALKFLNTYPEIAERIRLTKEHRDVQAISAEHLALVDPAFTASVVENVRLFLRFSVSRTTLHLRQIHEVISLKFRQHADLRYNLCDLDDDTQIIYNDPSDSFWGIGFDGQGMNELGLVLQRVMKELKPKRPPRQAS